MKAQLWLWEWGVPMHTKTFTRFNNEKVNHVSHGLDFIKVFCSNNSGLPQPFVGIV